MFNVDGSVNAWYNVWVASKKKRVMEVCTFLGQFGVQPLVHKVGKDTYIFIPWSKDAGVIHKEVITHFSNRKEV